MPGIVGLITRMPPEQAEAELRRMVDSLRHEAFYEAGIWLDHSLGVYIGWIARQGSGSEAMPLYNERGDVGLVFSGEDYPEPGLVQSLKARGHEVAPARWAYLVHASEEDPAFPAGLNGRFHGLLMDRTHKTAMLFNDRYGMHRVYFHQAKEAFYFAAEAKAILAVRSELRTPDFQGLGELVATGHVLQDRTIFNGIHVLPAAAAWHFEDGLLTRKAKYFHVREWENQTPLEAESYYQHLRDVFSRNLPRYFNGSAPIGIALTGGLDTRAIMAWRKPKPASLPCYTYGGTFRDCQDVQIARQVATACRQPHAVISVGDEFLSRFSHYAERATYLAEGCVDVSNSPDLYVSEKARAIAPVKIVGTYGSEIIGRTVVFKPEAPVLDLFRPEFVSYVNEAVDTYNQVRSEHPLTFAAVRQSQWHHHGIFALEETQLGVRSPFLDNDFVRTVYRAPKFSGVGDCRLRMISEGNSALSRIRSDRGVGGTLEGFSAAVFRSFLEFTVKAEYAYDSGMPQWLARIDHLLSPFHFERFFLGRHKFSHFRVWYRDSLADYVKQMLLDPMTLSRQYVQRRTLERVVRGHLEGNRNYTKAIHKLLTLELLHRLFFDSRSSIPSLTERRIAATGFGSA
jgi:asparagine synthase (glutamine-hydrolysing)